MAQISRRQFIQAGLIGAAAASTGFAGMSYISPADSMIDRVKLGKTGVGRSTSGAWNRNSRRKTIFRHDPAWAFRIG